MAPTDEEREMIQGFVADGYELLDELEPNLIELQKSCEQGGSADIEKLNAVFRLFHSLKGAAGFFNLHNVTSVTHEAETLLNLLREGKIVLTPERTSVLCQACDFMRTLLTAIEENGNDHGFEETAQQHVRQLSAAVSGINRPFPAPTPSPPEQQPTPAAEPSITITTDMVQSFIQEADELLDSAEQSLLALEKAVDKTEPLQTAFRSIHSFKGNCGFMGYRDLERLSHAMENVLDGMRTDKHVSNEKNIGIIMRSLDALKNAVAELSQGGTGIIQGCDLMVELLRDLAPRGETTQQHPPKIGEILIALGETTPEAVEKALSLQDKPLGEMLVDMGAASKDAVDAALAEQEKQAGKKIVRRDIRVDLDKLDLLMDLVGEMVIAQMMVIHNPDLRGLELEHFEKAAHHLQRISADLQDVALSIRMVPLSATFRKMIRLVHDLSLKFSKKVKLELKGEETEVDKTVIEHISDPLVHIIRNAIDHGIESPEQRRTAGKDETGIIILEAGHDGGEVVIRISDDGAGLRRDKILRKGIERGLVVGNGEGMRDEEVFNLIFEPGFSTADVVTDISGRGVGMDVVRKNLEKIKGRVDVSSTPGVGTTFVLRIPLTLAIIEGMLVRTGRSKFIIPLLSIVESFRPMQQHITVMPDGTEMVKVRESLIQVVRLHKLYNVMPDFNQLHEGILITVESQHERICLFVDEVIGQMQTVIKALPSYVGDVQGLSGCSIMGDGEVCLILDVGALIRKAKHKTAHAVQAA
ncbi:MAG: chemotaxis protein CheA [Desulfobacterota bacterium]|nr:chemotaxis protein CheA [Thermodesulfobacteriota bacterium]